jgi:fatty acid/phospholipid biosynthesis enzyme
MWHWNTRIGLLWIGEEEKKGEIKLLFDVELAVTAA